MADPRTGDSPHDLLLALAGRLDDDLLAWCRELVAVGEDGRAVELACATLAADRAALPPAVRAALVAAARAARTDLDADAALPPAVDTEVPHRFDATLPVVDELAATVAGLPGRQVAGCRLHVTARTTPAGAAPGPLPQPVVVAEVGADDARPLDVLAYRLATACARAGVTAPVEVVVAGAALPAYQRAALRTARRVGEDRPATAARPATAPADPPPAPAAPPLDGPRWSEPEPAVAPAPAGGPGATGPESDAVPEPASAVVEPVPAEPGPTDPAAETAAHSPAAEPAGTAPAPEPLTAAEPAAEIAAEIAAETVAPSPAAGAALPEPTAAGPAAALSESEPRRTRHAAWPAARETGPPPVLADRMAAWEAPAASRPVRDAEPADGPSAPGRADVGRRADDQPAAVGTPDHRPFRERTDGRAVDDQPAGPEPVEDHPPVERAAAGPDPEEPARRRAPQESVDDRADAPAPRDHAAEAPAPVDRGVAPAEPVPFVRMDSGPVSFEPASADPVVDDERPRWPTTGGLVLPRRRRAAEPAPADEPPAPVDQQDPTGPSRRPTALRPLRPAAETGGRRARPAAPGDEPPQHAVVRPLRPAPPDAPALASLVDPPSGSSTAEPGSVIDEYDPLGLGRSPLSGERAGQSAAPAADSWSTDWLTGDWAVRTPPPAAAPATGPAPASAPPPDEPASLLRPETAARLNDEDRELLARLQAELGAGARSRAAHRAGATPGGRASRPTPPDLAG